jgi:hypothetical protein
MKKTTTSSLSGQKSSVKITTTSSLRNLTTRLRFAPSSVKTFRNKSVRHIKEKRNKKRGTQKITTTSSLRNLTTRHKSSVKKRGGAWFDFLRTDQQKRENLQTELTDLNTKSQEQGISKEQKDPIIVSIQSVKSQISELEKKIALEKKQQQVPTKPANAQSESTNWFSSLFGPKTNPVPAKTNPVPAKNTP